MDEKSSDPRDRERTTSSPQALLRTLPGVVSCRPFGKASDPPNRELPDYRRYIDCHLIETKSRFLSRKGRPAIAKQSTLSCAADPDIAELSRPWGVPISCGARNDTCFSTSFRATFPARWQPPRGRQQQRQEYFRATYAARPMQQIRPSCGQAEGPSHNQRNVLMFFACKTVSCKMTFLRASWSRPSEFRLIVSTRLAFSSISSSSVR